MKLINKRVVTLFIGIASLFLMYIYLPTEQKSENIKIGVSDDISGFVIDYMIKEKELNASLENNFESFSIRDC
ncbi:hypothetical protein P4S50_03575 [Tepidibacter hydrothermalis]|uniref:Uncharacterized protein n=3 Tax=Tepidibacter hydrothermalis TaxID=3036126 RepID=A0ABY8EDZ3_9FIRM|nr:hypothetical protein [Tepidibacter hydrothermalis]WFD11169.1 hypothetical protein P4S50_03575 [Tepidibacter hydrothermalis]